MERNWTNHSTVTTNKNVSFASILSEKTFLLYFIAWFMFPLIDRFERVLIDQFLITSMNNLLDIMGIIEPIVAGLSILVAGLMCDWVGRKKVILSGFVALGVAYAIIGLAPLSVISWYLYFIVDGVAWGIFLLTFVLILWGDLSQPGTREKYYALGSVPFFLSYVIPQFLTQSFIEKAELTAAFSLASFFLFIAVLPLLYAPETLPEKKMELRRLRKFAEDAKKAKEKYERKI
jgi:MFS family permease